MITIENKKTTYIVVLIALIVMIFPYIIYWIIEHGKNSSHLIMIFTSLLSGSIIAIAGYFSSRHLLLQRLGIFRSAVGKALEDIRKYRKGVMEAKYLGTAIVIDGTDVVSDIQKQFNELLQDIRASYVQHQHINAFFELTDCYHDYHDLHEQSAVFFVEKFKIIACEIYYKDKENFISRTCFNMEDYIPSEAVMEQVDHVFDDGKGLILSNSEELNQEPINEVPVEWIAIRALKHENQVFGVVVFYQTMPMSSDDAETMKLIMGQYTLAHQSAVQYSRLQEMATKDELTGAWNRRYGMELSRSSLHRSETDESHSTVAVMDIDHFKKINDTWGHQAGDFILKHFSRAISGTIRATDIFLRYGGEEFLLIIPGADADIAMERCNHIRKYIEDQQFIWKGERIPVTMSVGFMSCRNSTENIYNIEKLIHYADDALYFSKKNGRNVVSMGIIENT